MTKEIVLTEEVADAAIEKVNQIFSKVKNSKKIVDIDESIKLIISGIANLQNYMDIHDVAYKDMGDFAVEIALISPLVKELIKRKIH